METRVTEEQLIRIGRFVLWRFDDDRIWISWDGEGGAFPEADLARAIERFYAEHF